MICPQCRGEETKLSTEIDDGGDIEIAVCANEECGWIIKRTLIVKRPDGSEHRRPQRVEPGEQPQTSSGPMEVVEPLPTMEEMMRKAIRVRQETVGRQINERARIILEECVDPAILLSGKHKALLEQELPGEVVNGVYEELKNLGYKIKRIPEPGKGTWIELSWPTKQKRKKKEPAPGPSRREEAPEAEITFPKQTGKIPKRKASAPPKKTPPRAASESTKKQQAAKKKRMEALKARSDLPK